MKLKKFTARTEREAVEAVKNELGPEALVLSIRKTRTRGAFPFLPRQNVEVIAAREDEIRKNTDNSAAESVPAKKALAEMELTKERDRTRDLEGRLNGAELLLGRLAGQLSAAEEKLRSAGGRKFENEMVQMIHDELVNNGVMPEIAEELLNDADSAGLDAETDGGSEKYEKIDISVIVKIVYNSIIGVLGAPEPVSLPKTPADPARYAFFIGPTGVGKTTTIAKISAGLILNQKKRVRLITADTYRIAAVEQLKTYADILGIGVTVVYSADELRADAEAAREQADAVLIDTAGRSHKNAPEMDELRELLAAVPESDKFLVMSLTMKREDMLAVVDAHEDAGDFRLIFTKLDETERLGEILNICRLTGRKLAYVTNGQSVPDDILVARPETVAKALLGIVSGV